MRALLKLILPILLAAATVHSRAEVALPRFDIANSDCGAVTNLWWGNKPIEFPKQFIVDFSREKNGVVLGIVCEYKRTEGLFASLRERLQSKLPIEPFLENKDRFIVWRDVKNKRTITLTLDKEEKNIQVIIGSIDKAVRGPHFFPE